MARGQAHHEQPVDLQLRRRQLLQVGQRGQARAIVVDGDRDAGVGQPLEVGQGVLGIGDDRGLGDLHADGAGRTLARLLEQPAGELPVRHQPAREVDVDRHGMAVLGQGLLVGDGLLHHPAGDLGDGAGFFSQADEAVGRHHAVLGVVPADQGLDGVDLAGARPELGLVVHIEFVARQGPVQVAHQLHAFGDRPALLGAEAGDLGVAGLGPGQGHGGVLDHGVVAGVDLGVADRHVDIDALVGDLERPFQLGARAVEDMFGLARAGGWEQDLDLGPPDAAQAHLGHMPGEPAAKDIEDFAGQLGPQLASQLAEAAEAHDGHEQLLVPRLGIGGGDAVQQRGAGRVADGQGHGQPIGDGVEGFSAAVAGRQASRQVAGREAAQGVGEACRRRRCGRLGRVGTHIAHAGSRPWRSGARRHGREMTANLLKLPLIRLRRGQFGVQGARLGCRAASFPQIFDPDRDQPATQRQHQSIAWFEGSTGLVQAGLDARPEQPDTAFLDEARRQGPGLEEARAPKPDVGAAAVLGGHPRTRLRGVRRWRRGGAGLRAASAAKGEPATLGEDAWGWVRSRRCRQAEGSPAAGLPTGAKPSARISSPASAGVQPSSSTAWSARTEAPPCQGAARNSSPSRSSASTGTACRPTARRPWAARTLGPGGGEGRGLSASGGGAQCSAPANAAWKLRARAPSRLGR